MGRIFVPLYYRQYTVSYGNEYKYSVVSIDILAS